MDLHQPEVIIVDLKLRLNDNGAFLMVTAVRWDLLLFYPSLAVIKKKFFFSNNIQLKAIK